MTIIINTNEMNALRYITKPSSYQRLYSKLGEINSMDGKLNEYLGKKNYTMVDEIYDKKGVIKQSIVKNQLTLLRLYQHLITSKKNNDSEYILTIQDALVPLLIETISRATERIQIAKERNYATKYEASIQVLFDSILTKIENNTEGYKIYMASKELSAIKNIIDFNDYLKEEKK